MIKVSFVWCCVGFCCDFV